MQDRFIRQGRAEADGARPVQLLLSIEKNVQHCPRRMEGKGVFLWRQRTCLAARDVEYAKACGPDLEWERERGMSAGKQRRRREVRPAFHANDLRFHDGETRGIRLYARAFAEHELEISEQDAGVVRGDHETT